ncbi:thioredoxin H-type-like protein, partial [Tanacetum coccineum]
GNGELCFPRDDVPNNYTGYGDREYSWQANPSVSHPKPYVYRVETKVVVIRGQYSSEVLKLNNALTEIGLIFMIIFKQYGMSPFAGMRIVTQPEEDETKSHPQFREGNGELCFPRDDVPNNYTGYVVGYTLHNFQGTWDVAFRLHENRSALDWFIDDIHVIYHHNTNFDTPFINKRKYLLTQPEEDETESHPRFAGGNVTLVTKKDARERTVSEAKAQGKIGNGELCFPCDDVPNNYTGYGDREYSWKANPSVSHPKPDVYRVETKGILSNTHLSATQLFPAQHSGLRFEIQFHHGLTVARICYVLVTAVVVTRGQYSSEVLKLNIALTKIGLIFLIISKEYGMSPFACMRIAVLLIGSVCGLHANNKTIVVAVVVYFQSLEWRKPWWLSDGGEKRIREVGNGELYFPHDDVPNNYTGYGDREYSWQANPSVSHPKPDVYRVETKGILSNTHLSATQLFPAQHSGLRFEIQFHHGLTVARICYVLVTAVVVTRGQYSSENQPEEDETESHPQFAGGNVTLVTTKDAWERKVSEAKAQGKIGNGELCFPRDDVPNNYTGYGDREYSWQENPSVSHPKPDVYRVETKVVVVIGGQYSSEVLKLNIALIEIGLVFLIIFKTQPEEDETESHPQFAGGNVTLVTTKDAWERKVSEAKAQGKIGNGELCFPRDDVPNNYTGYGDREYSWQSKPLCFTSQTRCISSLNQRQAVPSASLKIRELLIDASVTITAHAINSSSINLFHSSLTVLGTGMFPKLFNVGSIVSGLNER